MTIGTRLDDLFSGAIVTAARCVKFGFTAGDVILGGRSTRREAQRFLTVGGSELDRAEEANEVLDPHWADGGPTEWLAPLFPSGQPSDEDCRAEHPLYRNIQVELAEGYRKLAADPEYQELCRARSRDAAHRSWCPCECHQSSAPGPEAPVERISPEAVPPPVTASGPLRFAATDWLEATLNSAGVECSAGWVLILVDGIAERLNPRKQPAGAGVPPGTGEAAPVDVPTSDLLYEAAGGLRVYADKHERIPDLIAELCDRAAIFAAHGD